MSQLLLFDCLHQYRAGFQLELHFEMAQPVVALSGPSGSGKTTVLQMIAGLLRPQQGIVRLGEKTLTDTRQNIFLPPEQRGIGLVFQELCLFPHMTVRGNLLYGAHRLRGQPDADHLCELTELLEIGPLLDRYPQSLSGGQRQRVALGRALLSRPRLLLLDEPLSALERPLQERILIYLKRVLDAFQLPTLLVTHDRAHVEALTRSIIEIRDGRRWSSDSPSANVLPTER